MDRHLVAIEVGVIGCTNQRMELDRFSFHQNRLESLDTESMQSRRTIEQHRMLLNDIIQNVPNLWADFFHHSLRAFDIMRHSILNQPLHDERLEQFQSHLFRQAALIEFQFRANNDNASAGVVHSLAQQVLSETALLSFQHI